ncbi:hypothetical protein P692DRAFT_20826294 [Suillus brevipes Sb2]|nr:hypothetical protein P692DRAFT_20826294 [Suillus brevipes Sb2]
MAWDGLPGRQYNSGSGQQPAGLLFPVERKFLTCVIIRIRRVLQDSVHQEAHLLETIDHMHFPLSN